MNNTKELARRAVVASARHHLKDLVDDLNCHDKIDWDGTVTEQIYRVVDWAESNLGEQSSVTIAQSLKRSGAIQYKAVQDLLTALNL
jgi:hypothetical protein